MDRNRGELAGRLTRDVDLKYTASGLAVAKVGLAVNRRRKKGEEWVEETGFFDITLFGRQAETASELLSKGRGISVDYHLTKDSWTNKDGEKRSGLSVIGDKWDFAERKDGGNAADETHPAEAADKAADKDDIPF